MAADTVIYCLTKVTDYLGFERFCCDLMVRAGWTSLEPLGGTGDGGRDAIHEGRHRAEPVLFAFSVREDWNVKLTQDLTRIKTLGHPSSGVIFVTNREVTTQERDAAIARAKADFGFDLELYPAERIRVILVNRARALIRLHPNIFTPGFFADRHDLMTDVEQQAVSGNRELAAFELGINSRNMEYRTSLVAELAGPVSSDDLHVPLEHEVPRLTNAARVLLLPAQAAPIEAAIRGLRDAVFSSAATVESVLMAARQCEAQLAASKPLLTDDRVRAAFTIGETLSEWDRRSGETRDVSADLLRNCLDILGAAELNGRVDALVQRFREARSVMDVHVPSEIADQVRQRLSLGVAPTNQRPTTADWSEAESLLREARGRFRRDDRPACRTSHTDC